MAHPITETIQKTLELDKDQIIRPNYGQTSMVFWEAKYKEYLDKLKFINKYSEKVAQTTNDTANNNITSILSHLDQLTRYNESDYVAHRQSQINSIEKQYNQLLSFWPHYAIAAIEESGLLSNVDVREKFQSLTDNLKKQTDDALKRIETESNDIINNAKEKASKIESSVRKTAQKVSVQEAQEQFKTASDHNILNIKIWSVIVFALIGIFIALIVYLLKIKLPDIWTWQIVYFSVIRLALLTLVSTLIAFALKILRSHLHMHQHNLHRQRIANSMSAFAESASSQDQRDLILTQLVESVAGFGNSGIIDKDDEAASKITIDNITRTLSTLKGQ